MIKDFRFIFFGSVMLLLAILLMAQRSIQDRPNIVWLVTEDNSKHYLQLYEEDGAAMPQIESLAEQGIVFNHAFSNAPVCSVARSTLISGCYAPRLGAQYHRRMKLAPMPEGQEMFPYYLRKEGYYTTNNSKEDYNLIKSDQVWDESSRQATYKNRKKDQPFFHVQNFGITHEGRLHFPAEQIKNVGLDSDSVQPFPYHPNTEVYRYTYAWYYDLHRKADDMIGKFIKELEEEGLMENTIIFYYGDHGGVLPRSKGYIYESGLHVPLVVYVPPKWKDRFPLESGTRTDAFVQFIDFGPTVLNLAGAYIPEGMDGKPFLGKGVSKIDLEKRNTAFGYADRFDEKYDLVRSYRKGKYKYIRNYQPFNIDALFNFYRYKMLAYSEWEQLHNDGILDRNQEQFFQPRAVEGLYDIENDPHELNNLAIDPSYLAILQELRKTLQKQVKTMPDLSFYPEPFFLERGIGNPVKFGQQNKNEIAELIEIADLSLLPFEEALKGIKKALKDENPWKRYWGLISCSSFGKEASSLSDLARDMMLNDDENLVRIRAVEFLGLNGEPLDIAMIKDIVQNAKSETEANLILNTIALLKSTRSDFEIDLPKDMFNADWINNEQDLVSRRIEFINESK